MTILKNCEIWYPKLIADKPDTKLDPNKPKWNLQIRTSSKAQKDEWIKEGLNPKLQEDAEGKIYYKLSLYKSALPKKDGTPAEPVTVVNGKNQKLDPKQIGNGSIGNIRIFLRDHTKDPDKKVAVLMAVQITKLKVYVYTGGTREEFEETEFEVEEPATDANDEAPAF